eukprot:230903_1
MTEIKFIVEKLNDTPFNKKFTLVSFDSLPPRDLLQIVNDVFAELDSKHRIKLRDEKTDDTSLRMVQFVRVLNYRPASNPNFAEDFMAARKSVLFPLLHWVLARIPDLKKRAYLARFLQPIDVPSEMVLDPAISESLQQLSQLQETFKEVHKEFDKIKSEGRKSPEDLQRELERLDTEQDSLRQKLERIEAKVEDESMDYGTNDFESMLNLTASLRTETAESRALTDRLAEQRRELERAHRRLEEKHGERDQLARRDVNTLSAHDLLSHLRDSVDNQRRHLSQNLPAQLDEVSAQCAELTRLLKGRPMTPDEVEAVSVRLEEKRELHGQLGAKRDEIMAATSSQLSFYRTRAAGVVKKKEAATERLKELQEEQAEAQEDINKLDDEMQAMSSDGKKPMTEAESKKYIQDLTAKTQKYKELKVLYQDSKSELEVLCKTVETLKSKDENVQELLDEMEQQKGVSGFQDTQEKIEKVSFKKAALDASKGTTLDSISGVVQKISSQLKAKKSKLAPLIKELRAVREKFKAVQSKFQEKKGVFDNISLGLDSELSKLKDAVGAQEKAYEELEKSFHLAHAEIGLLDAKLERVNRETSFQRGSDRLSQTHKTICDSIKSKIQKTEKRCKELRKEQKNVKSNQEQNMGQRNQFLALRELLAVKLQCVERSEHEGEEAMGGTDDVDIDGANRLVLLDD